MSIRCGVESRRLQRRTTARPRLNHARACGRLRLHAERSGASDIRRWLVHRPESWDRRVYW